MPKKKHIFLRVGPTYLRKCRCLVHIYCKDCWTDIYEYLLKSGYEEKYAPEFKRATRKIKSTKNAACKKCYKKGG